MLDKEKIIQHIIKKCGYHGTKNSKQYPTTLNKRIKKAFDEFLLFYDEDKEKLKSDLNSCKENVKWMFKFICDNRLKDKYKKETLKKLII